MAKKYESDFETSVTEMLTILVGKVGEMDGKIDEMDERLERIEDDVDEIKTIMRRDQKETEEKLEDHEKRIVKLEVARL